MGSRRKQPRPAPFAEQARCRPCGPSGRGGPSGPSGRPCPNDFKRLKRIRGVCSSSAGRPGSPSAGSALLLDLSARAALAGRFQWEGAFPGAASRVPRDLPRAIHGRPFRAARTQTHDRGVGFSRALCPPRPGTGSCPVLCPPRAGVAAKRPGVESCIPLPISGSNSSCLAVPLLRGKLRELAEKRVHDGRLRFHRHLAGTQPGLVSAQRVLGGRRQIAKAPVGL